MRNIRFLVPLIAFLCFLSCKKDAQVEKQTVPKVSITTTDLFFRGELDYEKSIAQIQGEKMRLVVPVINTDEQKGYRYKISEYIKDGDPARSGYILSLAAITKETDLFTLPINSKGSSFTNSKESGLSKDQRGKIVAKIKSGNNQVVKPLGEVLNLFANCQDMPPVCIDWYFVSYDPTTYQVVNEIFMYTTCYDPCNFNSNAGGSAPNENCNDVTSQLNSGPTSSDVGIDFVSEGNGERQRLYKWRFHKHPAGLWEFRSIEIGTHKQQPDGSWKWKDLVHQSVTRVGYTLGASIECTVNASMAEVFEQLAGMQLDYTITASAVCKGSPITRTENHPAYSPRWNVNQNPPVY